MGAGKAWRKEWTAELERLHVIVPRLTAQQVATELNRLFPEYHFGMQAVKKHRTALGRPVAPPKPKKGRVERRAAPDKAKVLLARGMTGGPHRRDVDLFAPDLSGLPGRRLTDLKTCQCRFEIGGGRNRFAFRFCGAAVVPLPPYAYCAEHAAKAYYIPDQLRRQLNDRT